MKRSTHLKKNSFFFLSYKGIQYQSNIICLSHNLPPKKKNLIEIIFLIRVDHIDEATLSSCTFIYCIKYV